MTIKSPDLGCVPALRRLWQQAFGDTDAFLDDFFRVGFSRERCRCGFKDESPVTVLYWFDCACGGRRLAYLYAAATELACRGQGLFKALMEDTHRHLRSLGYDGAVLVPGEPGLFAMYEKLGYATCCTVRQFVCGKANTQLPLRRIDPGEYAARRKALLPEGGVVQDEKTLAFLSCFSGFYAIPDAVLAASVQNGVAVVHELLGDVGDAERIVAALGASEGRFRTPGGEKAFAMFMPFVENCPIPKYFGLALD